MSTSRAQSLIARKCDGLRARAGHTQARKQTKMTSLSLAPGLKALQVQTVLGVSLGRCGSSRCDCL